MDIQMYQATSKGVRLLSEFFNFPLKDSISKNYKKYDIVPVDDMNTYVCSEEKRIKQVLMNLQSNAIKFTKEGGVVRIICEFIKKSSVKKTTSRTDFRNEYDFSSCSSESG